MRLSRPVSPSRAALSRRAAVCCSLLSVDMLNETVASSTVEIRVVAWPPNQVENSGSVQPTAM